MLWPHLENEIAEVQTQWFLWLVNQKEEEICLWLRKDRRVLGKFVSEFWVWLRDLPRWIRWTSDQKNSNTNPRPLHTCTQKGRYTHTCVPIHMQKQRHACTVHLPCKNKPEQYCPGANLEAAELSILRSCGGGAADGSDLTISEKRIFSSQIR